jgi:hypothetical protein
MSSFEESIVAMVHPNVAPLWAVADADGLFRSDEVERLLAERGVETVVFEEPLAFRYRYETTIRPALESAGDACFLILLEPGNEGFHRLPADVYSLARCVSIALGDKLPGLSRNVLAELEPAVLSRLWEKRDQFPAGALGDRDTADLILRIAYRIDPGQLETFDDLVASLLHLHLTGRRLPESLVHRLTQVMGGPYASRCEELIRNPGAFWAYLQNAWEQWVMGPDWKPLGETVPLDVSFTDPRIRVYMDNLFVEGYLLPIPPPDESVKLPAAWCQVGIASPMTGLDPARLIELQLKLGDEIPAEGATYRDWLQFAARYSQHVASVFSTEGAKDLIDAFWSDFWPRVDARFQPWILERLDSFHNLPPTRPVMAHHIPAYLRRRVLSHQRVLLLVLDGLSLSQWRVIKPFLQDDIEGIEISEDACFSLLPSVTNICRQSIYAGELPIFFEPTIHRTDCDGRRWKDFWDRSMPSVVTTTHGNVQGQDAEIGTVRDLLDANATAIGLTVRMSDELMHGAQLGWQGMLDLLRRWAGDGFLSEVIRLALERGFSVFLTSDHGNIEAEGRGTLNQGALVDRRGERVRTYQEETLWAAAAKTLGGRGIPFRSRNLPASHLPILHAGRGAYATPGARLVCHGGASLDEVVVPFIEFSKSTAKT